MPDPIFPSAAALVARFLREHSLLVPLHGGRVGTRLGGTYPAVRVQRVGGVPPQPWEDGPWVQVECWATDEGAADELARKSIAALGDVIGVYPEGAVRGHEIVGSLIADQDPTSNHYRQLFTVLLMTFENN